MRDPVARPFWNHAWGLLLLLTCLPAWPAHATYLQLTRIFIAQKYPEEVVATPAARISSPERPVRLYAVVEARAPGRLPTYFTDAKAIDLGWGLIPENQLRPWDNHLDGEIQVLWSRLEPEHKTYDNTLPQFHFEPISYVETPIKKVENQWSWVGDVRPTIMPDPAPAVRTGLGIGFFRVKVLHQGLELATPGGAGSFPGGLPEDVPSLSYRGLDADVLTSWTQARFNVPYVGGSSRRGKTDDSHQAIQGVGTDSLDLIVAGWRLAGHREVSFVGPFLLEPAHESRTTVQVTRGRPEGEHFITPTGDQIAVGPDSVIPGDILRSSRQAGVFARDLPPMGVLSDNDMVVTALFEEPRLLSIRDSLAGPITVLRWNELRELQLDLKLLRHFEGEIDGVASPQLLSAIKSIRSAAGLPPLQNEGGLAGLEKRWGTLQAVPPVARFSVFWKEHERLKLDPVDERAMLQRLVAQLSEAMGNPAEDGFVLTPPRKGMQAPLTARTADQPFLPQQASFWQLETAVPLIAQTFVVGDANRDGKVDATGVPAEVLAPGPGVILEAEGTWKGKRKPERVSLYGNQVWIYLPRVDVLLGYLGLGTVPVKVGDVVKTGAVLGTVGRTGEQGSSRKSPTQLRVVAFTGAKEGQFLPIDPASLWGLKVEEQLLPARRFVSSPPVVLSGEDPASSISPSDVPSVAPSAVSSPQTSPAEAPVGTPHER